MSAAQARAGLRLPGRAVWESDQVTDTRRLLQAAHDRLAPFMPDGSAVLIISKGRRTGLQREGLRFNDDGLPVSGYRSGTSIGRLGTWVPFLPTCLRRRLIAQDAVEQILAMGGAAHEGGGTGRFIDYDVRARTTPDGVTVSYQPVNDRAERIELPLFPADLF